MTEEQRQATIKVMVGGLVTGLLEHFDWVKVARAHSAFGAHVYTFHVTRIVKGTPLTIKQSCTEEELVRLNDPGVVIDFICNQMHKEITEKFGNIRKTK